MRAFLLFAVLLLFISCEKVSIDNEDPNIEVFLFNGAENPADISVQSNLSIELFITDNEQLQEVLIKIENVSNPNLTTAEKLLDLIVFSEIDSKQFGQTVEVELNDEDKAGRYEVLLQVVDANGNVDSRVIQFILLNPDEQPYLDINGFTPPVVDGVITMNHGDSLIVDGWMSDDVGLGFFKVRLTGPQSIYYVEQLISESGFTGWAFSWLAKPKIPENAATGEYNFSVDVTDSDGHMTFYSQPVVVE